MNFIYLKAEDIIKINAHAFVKFSPNELIGIIEPTSLQMVVAQPNQEVFDNELYPDIYSKAAILLINIATKYCFNNANERTAWIAMDVFLKANGYSTSFSTDEGIDLVLKIVTYREDFETLKDEVIDYLRNSNRIHK